MSDGGDRLPEQTALEEALALIVATFEHNKLFFGTRLAQLYEQLRHLVHYCRHHRRHQAQSLTQVVVQDELQRMFGVRVQVPLNRQLSLVASLMRHVLVSHVYLERTEARGGIQLLVKAIQRRLNAITLTSNIDLAALDTAIERLAGHNAQTVCLLELRYFARLSIRDVALELNLAVSEVERELRFARAWLLASLQVDSKKN